jgi:hypothetical protein
VSYSFLREAEFEYLQAIRFYEDQQAGLGRRLVAEFEHTIQIAEDQPLGWKIVAASDVSRMPFYIAYSRAVSCRSPRSHTTDVVPGTG